VIINDRAGRREEISSGDFDSEAENKEIEN